MISDKKKCGVMYIAFGEKAISDAVFSAESIKDHSPDLSITLKADSKIDNEIFDHVELIKPSPIHKRLTKIENLSKSPYEYSLYLDNDTKINHDLWEMFEILDRFDVALVQDFSRKRKIWSDLIPDYANIPYSFPEYCGGVILYRKSNLTKEFFDSWRELFLVFNVPLDQPILRIALWQSRLRIHTLPIEYNVREEENRNKWDKRKENGVEGKDHLKPRIFHWRSVHDPDSDTRPHYF